MSRIAKNTIKFSKDMTVPLKMDFFCKGKLGEMNKY